MNNMFSKTKTVAVAFLIGTVSLAACAAQTAATYPPKGQPPAATTQPEIKTEDILFKFDEKGNLVPVMVQGKKFEKCGKETGRECKIFTKAVNVTDVDDIDVTIIKSHNSPECAYVKSSRSRGGAAAGTTQSELCL
jgi:hypothetical protein